MITSSYPVFSPAPKNSQLLSIVPVSFLLDSEWLLLLSDGSYQGFPVKALSLFVDNSNNSAPISYVCNGVIGVIPQYAVGHVDIRNALDIKVTCANPVTVNFAIQNWEAEYRFNNPSFAPGVAAETDPFFSSVVGLYHFEALNGFQSFVDSASNGYGTIIGGASAYTDTSKFKFGTSSIRLTSGTYNCSSSKNISDYTIEAFIYVNSFSIANASYQVFGNNAMSAGIMVKSNGSNDGFTTGFRTNFGTIVSPYNTWTHIAATIVGGSSVTFVNGISDFNGGGGTFINTLTAIGDPSGVCNFNLDELRITSRPRYLSNFSVPTSAFPNS